ncbi:unnamed protein product [Phytomonas sp. Hart1]|nr:unnamed protein product [Phytomonas sp. Hart1]|eukprot:CCW70030.1 unnamed protein product [Phytomonas sp. isolate Hart1]
MSSKKRPCVLCNENHAVLKRPRNGEMLCQGCFFRRIEDEIHDTIQREKLFERGDIVASGASGGKDSTLLMHILSKLNKRYDYGIHLELISVDEGIKGYRDHSLETVKRNSAFYGLPLHILSYQDLYGWTMDEIVAVVGLKNSCTFCGVMRRQALERGAVLINANKIVTGHNADDTAETVLMNLLRGDAPRLARCTQAFSKGEGLLSRVKPLKYTYEKDIVLYAHFNKLDYFTTECSYAKEAFRGTVRTLIKELEVIQPRCIADIVHSGERIIVNSKDAIPTNAQGSCARCGYVTSQQLCRACVLLNSLNNGNPQSGLYTTS